MKDKDQNGPEGEEDRPSSPTKVFVACRKNTAAEMELEWAFAKAAAESAVRTTQDSEEVLDFNKRSLRLALAMRGGVSLAVWIGGTVAELDLLRSLRVFGGPGKTAVVLAWDREEAPPTSVTTRVALYGELLAANKYHRVEIDVFAGASAGGLNSVLAATAQSAGRSVDSALETWRTAGGLHQLLRPEGIGAVPSVLRGDDYFFSALLDRLEEFYWTDPAQCEPVPPHPGLVVEGVSVNLSATVLDAYDAENPMIRVGHAGFRFELGMKEANVPTDGNRDDLARLALAARTTSSFPGAFEPASIWSTANSLGCTDLPSGFKFSEDSKSPAQRILVSQAFMAQRPADADRFRVVDGGVFDNIPIERAFRAIRMRPAHHSVRRVLVYLDPSPPSDPPGTPPKADKKRRKLTDLFSVAAKSALARSKESAREDRQEMEEFLRREWERSGRQEVLAALVDPKEPINWSKTVLAYSRSRAATDKGFLEEVYEDPERWQLDSRPKDWKPEHLEAAQIWRMSEKSDPADTALSREDVVGQWLRAMSLEEMPNLIDPADPSRAARIAFDSVAARDASLILLECIKWLEMTDRILQTAPRFPARSAAPMREALYKILEESDRRVARKIKEVGVEIWANPSGTDALRRSPQQVRDEVWWPQGAVPEDLWDGLEQVMDDLLPILGQWKVDARDARDEGLALGVMPDPTSQKEVEALSIGRWWEEAPWQLLEKLNDELLAELDGQGVADRRAKLLAPLFSIVGSPAPTDPPLQFDITGNWQWDQFLTQARPQGSADAVEETLIPAIQELRNFHRHQVMSEVLRGRTSSGRPKTLTKDALNPTNLPASSRLAGTQLYNFGGFLSAQWREADWWWGRIDTAANMTDFLGSSLETNKRRPEEKDAAERATKQAVRKAVNDVVEQYSEELSSLDNEPDIRRKLTARAAGTDALLADYRVSLAQRGLRLVTRAMFGVRRFAKVFAGALTVLLAPLLNFLPAAVQPTRLVAAVTVFFTGLLLTQQQKNESAVDTDVAWVGVLFSWQAALGILTAAVVGISIWAARSVHKAWVRVDAFELDPEDRAEISHLRGRAWGRFLILQAAALAMLVDAWISATVLHTMSMANVYVVIAALFSYLSVGAAGKNVFLAARSKTLFEGGYSLLAYGGVLAFLTLPLYKSYLVHENYTALPPEEALASGLPVLTVVWPASVMAVRLFLTAMVLEWGTIGTFRKPPQPGQASTPAKWGWAPKTQEFIATTLLSLASGAVAGCAGAAIGPLIHARDWDLSNYVAWMWVVGALVWGNMLWWIPAVFRLEARSWSSDRPAWAHDSKAELQW